MDTKEIAIKFANWLREVDTQERACEWFGCSDSDMYDFFCSEFLSAPKVENKTFEM